MAATNLREENALKKTGKFSGGKLPLEKCKRGENNEKEALVRPALSVQPLTHSFRC